MVFVGSGFDYARSENGTSVDMHLGFRSNISHAGATES